MTLFRMRIVSYSSQCKYKVDVECSLVATPYAFYEILSCHFIPHVSHSYSFCRELPYSEPVGLKARGAMYMDGSCCVL